MKWALYNVLFALVYPFLLPGFLVRMLRRGGYAARFADRFALYPPAVSAKFGGLAGGHVPARGNAQTGTGFVWIHAVSVGEVQVAAQLMRAWREVEPGVRFCFSTTSSTGWKIAERELANLHRSSSPQPQPSTSTSSSPSPSASTFSPDVLIYNPLDFPNFVKSALKRIRPRAIILTESEIWPNFIRTAKRYGIPLFLINARVSDRSAPRYRAARWFFGDVFRSFTRIFAQSDLDKARLVAAGAPAERTEVTGSFKFDVAHRNPAKEREMAAWIGGEGVGDGKRDGKRDGKKAKILLGGSTWPGEDEVLIRIYKKIVEAGGRDEVGGRDEAGGRAATERSPYQVKTGSLVKTGSQVKTGSLVKLVIAPRHFEKADAVEANIRKAGFGCVRRSRGERGGDGVTALPTGRFGTDVATATGRFGTGAAPMVYLADTTGELMGLYGIADVVFVGKSLCAHGSQNMIEPCLCGKPTFVGPYTENFRPVMSDLLASDAIVQVKDADELEERIIAALTKPDGLGARASAAVLKRLGVVPKCVAAIREVLS